MNKTLCRWAMISDATVEQKGGSHLERRQPEGVATVLDAESAEKVAVHGEHDGTPGKSGDTLSTRVCHTGDLESKRNGCKGKNGVCGMVRTGVE